MGRIVVLGEEVRVLPFALVGVDVYPVEPGEATRAALAGLPEEIEVVILTHTAAAALAGLDATVTGPLTVILPPTEAAVGAAAAGGSDS